MTSTATTAEAVGSSDSYTKLDISFGEPAQVSRLWGIPLLGYMVRALALLPHVIILTFASIPVALSLVIAWIPVLFLGRQPLAGLYAWFFGYAARLGAWMFFLTAKWPPIIGGAGDDYPVQLRMPTDRPMNRLWGVPYFGMVVRYILLIPHLIVAFAFGFVAYFIMLVLWIFILINGRVPGGIHAVLAGLLRQQARIGTWLYLCPLSYPPILP